MSTSIQMDRASARAAQAGSASPLRLLRDWLSRRRRIGRIEGELHLHTDRELADLGLSRADIPAVARGHFRRG